MFWLVFERVFWLVFERGFAQVYVIYSSTAMFPSVHAHHGEAHEHVDGAALLGDNR